MSDFEGVDFITDMPESSGALDPAPEGTHDAKIIDVEKYKSPNSGNWTCKIVFQIDGGKYRDHTEWYNLWHPNPETKKLSNALFTNPSVDSPISRPISKKDVLNFFNLSAVVSCSSPKSSTIFLDILITSLLKAIFFS